MLAVSDLSVSTRKENHVFEDVNIYTRMSLTALVRVGDFKWLEQFDRTSSVPAACLYRFTGRPLADYGFGLKKEKEQSHLTKSHSFPHTGKKNEAYRQSALSEIYRSSEHDEKSLTTKDSSLILLCCIKTFISKTWRDYIWQTFGLHNGSMEYFQVTIFKNFQNSSLLCS